MPFFASPNYLFWSYDSRFVVYASGARLMKANIDGGSPQALKRAIERLLVHPLCQLIASRQIVAGDFIRVDYQTQSQSLAFALEDVDDMDETTDDSLFAIHHVAFATAS